LHLHMLEIGHSSHPADTMLQLNVLQQYRTAKQGTCRALQTRLVSTGGVSVNVLTMLNNHE